LINYITDKLFDKLTTKIMEHKLNTFKADLYNVFVEGNANNIQMARVFVVLAVPVMIICMIAFHKFKY
jgi:hypothetical protein